MLLVAVECHKRVSVEPTVGLLPVVISNHTSCSNRSIPKFPVLWLKPTNRLKPVVDEGLSDVSGFLVLRRHIQADCSDPPVQSLDHRKFVGQGMVRHEVQVAISVGGFSKHSGQDEPVWILLEQNVQKWELAFDSTSAVNCMLRSTPLRWSKNSCILEVGSAA